VIQPAPISLIVAEFMPRFLECRTDYKYLIYLNLSGHNAPFIIKKAEKCDEINTGIESRGDFQPPGTSQF
jgi:hypothetical protein